ncbi:hypothetical protein C8R44DRAFT_751670 [Mycena epipterygia]|nr:hypothetical protein C8R44DRAFT_751670 [Mycena epipterygia]
MSTYQPLATSALEICVSTIPHTGKKASSLAVHAVKRKRALIVDGFGIPLPPERREGLDKFEGTHDMIHQHIESIPEPGSKSQRIFSGLRFGRESATESRTGSSLQWPLVSLSTQAAGIALDLPVLNVLKPLVGIAALICHTAKVIIIQLCSEHDLIMNGLNTNRTAAIALAGCAQEVTTYLGCGAVAVPVCTKSIEFEIIQRFGLLKI